MLPDGWGCRCRHGQDTATVSDGGKGDSTRNHRPVHGGLMVCAWIFRVCPHAGGGAIHRLSMRLDGFASIGPDNPAAPAIFVTTPIRFTGSTLFLNAVVGDGGSIQIGIQQVGITATASSNFTLASCVNVSGDLMYNIPVEWIGVGSNVSALAGRIVELQFRLVQARLYGYKFL